MIDEYLVHGTQEQVEDQVESDRRAGVDLTVLFPVAPEGGDWQDAVGQATAFVARAAKVTGVRREVAP